MNAIPAPAPHRFLPSFLPSFSFLFSFLFLVACKFEGSLAYSICIRTYTVEIGSDLMYVYVIYIACKSGVRNRLRFEVDYIATLTLTTRT
ncbi:hypothetical protein DFH27DRAFT_574615 [Peziza echinospora]|nr:hypothetical protein DFH27DRAFT_574615 [Peziza echinospora]